MISFNLLNHEKYPIYVAGGITRLRECDSCSSTFAYLVRPPHYPYQKHNFPSREAEREWRVAELASLEKRLEGQIPYLRCPRGNHSARKLPLTKLFLQWFSSFILPPKPAPALLKPCSSEEGEALYFQNVCAFLQEMFPSPSSPNHQKILDQVVQRIYQKTFLCSAGSCWGEDLLWKIALLDYFKMAPKNAVDSLFQAVYLINVLEPRVYPAIPKKVMEFFSLDFFLARNLIQQLGEELPQSLIPF